MWKPSSSISTLALGAVLSTSLVLGGCDKKSNEAVQTSQLGKQIKARKVSDSEAMQALKLMGLEASGSERLTWAARSGEAGNYTFTDLGAADKEDNDGRIEEMVLRGVHMEGENPAFDQIVFKGLSSNDNEAVVGLKSLTLSNPSPALAAAIGQTLGGDDDAFDDIEGDVSFSGFDFSGFNLKSDEANMKLGELKIAKSKDGKGHFTLDNFSMDVNEKDTKLKFDLGSINVKGANVEKYKGLFSEVIKAEKNGTEFNANVLEKMTGALNPYDPDFESYSLNNFHMDAMGMVINLDKIYGEAKEKGGKIYMSQTMSPLTITPPKGENLDPKMQQFAQSMQSLGYESLEFTSDANSVIDAKADRMSVENGHLTMKDGFKLSMAYDMLGYAEYLKASLETAATASSNPMAALDAMQALKVEKAHLELRDNGIVDAAFKLAAQMQGGTPDALRTQAKMGLAFLPMMAQDEGQQKLATQLGTALGSWLENGGTMVFDMKPGEAIAFTDFMGLTTGALDVSTLGVTISHEK